MLLKKVLVIFLLSALIIVPGGCSTETGKVVHDAQEVENINIITTIFPLADIITSIGGERVEVTTLLSPGDSPHTFEPSVEQARKTSEASLMFYIGGGLDDWAVDLARGEGVPTVEVMEHMDQRILDYDTIHLEEDNHHGCEHYHGSDDPHVWMDPVLVKEVIVPLVYGELKAVSPEDESYFTENLGSYQEALEELHQDIEKTVKGFSEKRFISYHSAWNYFAHRYCLEEAAAIEVFPGKEPSARWLTELVDLAGEKNIQVIFAEPQLRDKSAETIAEEIDGKVMILDPLGGEGIPGRESYVELIQYNLEVFKEALE